MHFLRPINCFISLRFFQCQNWYDMNSWFHYLLNHYIILGMLLHCFLNLRCDSGELSKYYITSRRQRKNRNRFSFVIWASYMQSRSVQKKTPAKKFRPIVPYCGGHTGIAPAEIVANGYYLAGALVASFLHNLQFRVQILPRSGASTT